MKWILIGTCAMVVGVAAVGFARMDEDARPTGRRDQIAGIAHLSTKERMELIDELSRERGEIQRDLIRELRHTTSEEIKITAAFLLGIYRMEEAVRHLAEVITLESKQDELYKRLPLWSRYPVVEALIRIGKPSVRVMIQNIASSDDKKVRELSAKVIRYVEGREIGRIVLEKAAEKQTDPAKKARLKGALDLDYFKLPEEKTPDKAAGGKKDN